MVIRQRAIQAEDKQERHDAILDAAERVLLAFARPRRERRRGRRRRRAREGHRLSLFPEQGRAAARRARAQHRRVLPRRDRAASKVRRRCRSTRCSRLTHRHIVDPPLFLPLASRCFGLMAHSVPGETALAFKQRMATRLERAGAGLERHFPTLPRGGGVALLASQLRADPRPVADVAVGRRRRFALREGRAGGVAGLRLELSDGARCRAARAVAGHDRRRRRRCAQ